ncbi:DUF1127 domain-containing protein [Rhizobium paknamense]|uniref:Uncharacterized protein YjiS (DUF1127 family) n=1 Tax=Rhizobium paknamense TaxID=1206817 RepID=A0ABU0I9M2_9HYPH|nr:DUF1127 domain-containing protein [Rhizobium paknamense]MDQ0454917.1 uncharacterized protein YjiS (DUF1127 family) [Rhizobium paknamense]
MLTAERFGKTSQTASLSFVVMRLTEKVFAFARSLRNRRAVSGLTELDDTLLRDIGLTRAELNAVLSTAGLFEDPSRKLAVKARMPKYDLAEPPLG